MASGQWEWTGPDYCMLCGARKKSIEHGFCWRLLLPQWCYSELNQALEYSGPLVHASVNHDAGNPNASLTRSITRLSRHQWDGILHCLQKELLFITLAHGVDPAVGSILVCCVLRSAWVVPFTDIDSVNYLCACVWPCCLTPVCYLAVATLQICAFSSFLSKHIGKPRTSWTEHLMTYA